MTIKDVANLFGISTAAVYKSIKAHDLQLQALMDPSTKQLTEEGEKAVRALFQNSGSQPVNNGLSTQVDELTTQLQTKIAEAKALADENAQLKATLSAAQKEAEMLRAQMDKTTDALTAAQEALERAQQLQALTLQRIPPALPAHKPGLFERLFKRKGADQDADR